jgi:nitrogen fixation/metabolism regulation signal transduction histidine kinase
VLLLLVTLTLTVCIAFSTERGRDYHLRTAGNLIDAIREGDYSIRARASGQASGFASLVGSINALAAQLRTERLAVHETLQLLSKVLASLDSAVMTFADDGRLRFINPAGERLLAGAAATLIGSHCSELGVEELLRTSSTRVQSHAFSAGSGRWQVTSTTMRSQTQAGQLLVIQPIEQALRHEEARAFGRLLRVLGHEINNSLAPITSVADTLLMLTQQPLETSEQQADLRSGLRLIEERGAALQRFIAGYAQLARLPAPQPAVASLRTMVSHSARLFSGTGVEVEICAAEDLHVWCDADQVQQAMINLLRNAVDASAGRGPISLRWRRTGTRARLEIADCGEGLPPSDNLFVPFFTTKAEGSGIGLVLSRQIIEAQHGSLELSNRRDAVTGAVAVLELPLSMAPAVSGQ